MVTSSTSYESLDMDACCRLCGTEQGIRVSIFEPGTDHVKKIHKVLPITVNEHDPFPKTMCHRCSFKVNEFFDFRSKCIKAQELFRNKVPWLRHKQETSQEHNFPPMVEVPLNNIDSVSPNEKLVPNGTDYIDENETMIVIDDDSSTSEEDSKLQTKLLNGPQNKILMRFEKADIKKKSKPTKKSIWDSKRRKRKSHKTCKIAEVFTANVDTFLEMDDIENDPLQLSPVSMNENNINHTQSNPNKGNNNVEQLPLSGEINENLNLPKHILVTNIPREGLLYTCEYCGRTFLSHQPASLHSCDTVNGTNNNRTEENDRAESQRNKDYYKCNECDKVFSRQSQLDAHNKKHFEEDDSSDEKITRTKTQLFNHRRKFKRKSKNKPSIMTPKSYSPVFIESEPRITRHSLLSSDSE